MPRGVTTLGRPMFDTSETLLDQLRLQPTAAAWQRLVDLYTPLIRSWLRRHAAPEHDVDDLVQEVLTVVVRKLPQFERAPRAGAFRCWLRSITVNCLREFWRTRRLRPAPAKEGSFGQVLSELEDSASDLSELWDQEHDRHITERLLEYIKPLFAPTTWTAFCRVVVDDIPPTQVAQEMGISVNAVFIAKSRVMTRLRQEGRGLID